MNTLELLIDTTQLDPAQWLDFPDYGFRQYFLFKNPATGDFTDRIVSGG